VVGWYGVIGPAKLPKPVLAKLHAEISKYVKSPEFGAVAEKNGSEATSNSPEEFRQFMLNDMKKWSDVVKRAGIKVQ
jgi:tripartite-type tricarboxylate transporter receptor subunit TctC